MTKILLVEDDKSIVDNLSEYLKGEDFIVESAAGQKQAISKIEKNRYDLVLLDVSLLDGNGFAVCSYIKSNRFR